MAIPGFRIIRKIRQGGMSTVYLATQNSVDREVALKVMSPSLGSDPGFGSRFYREAKIVGKLSHPNIVSIYDVGSHKHYNYIAMDYLPGAPLQDRLETGLHAHDAIKTIREIASALNYAHSMGFIHRDIKPDNILYRTDGSAVLCDFGIAKALKGDIKMTSVGAVLGTPHYMSPEQAQRKTLDGRADIYSLGVVFFEILTGQVPFSGDDAVAVAIKHMTSSVPKLPRQYKKFQPIIDKMMAKKVSDRYQSGDEVINALEQLTYSLSPHSQSHLTPTGSTTVLVVNVVSALLVALGSAINLSLKRLMLTKIQFSNDTVPLSNKQLEDLDSFIFNDDYSQLPDELSDMPLIQDTIEQPSFRSRQSRLLWPLLLISVIATGLVYFLQSGPEVRVELQLTSNSDRPLNVPIKPNVHIAEIAMPETAVNNDAKAPPDSDIEEIITEQRELPKAIKKSYSLTISTVPENAKIRILNIKPRYQSGMQLSAGSFHIEVSAENYHSETFWLRIKNQPVRRHIELIGTRRLLAAGTITNDTFSNGQTGPQMVVLPQQTLSIKQNNKQLALNYAIAISQNEITFDEYDAFASQTGRSLPNDFGWGRGNRPVIGISYHDAVAYAQWLSAQTQQHYRLPTLPEWEYAYRGGQNSNYWWGEERAYKRANCKKGCKSKYSRLFRSSTAPTASFEANPYNLYDTAGNVAEWLDACQHWLDQDKTLCTTTLIAGGSHQDTAKNIQANSTETIKTDMMSKSVGLRLLLEL